jgi:hypothetical protein
MSAIRAIVDSQMLQTGYLSYVEASPGLYKKVNPDLTVAYLTNPSIPRQIVVVDAHETEFGYVDLLVSAEIPVLQIERDILLIPMAPRTQNWIAQYYIDRENGSLSERSARIYAAELNELAARGGPNLTPAAIPIQIVGHSPLP